MDKLKVLDLFSGIGGFSLGLEKAGGFETAAFCEIEEYPRKVLARHWPNVPIYQDVRELTAERLSEDGISVDVVTGGFPCQDISTAGRQAGIEGERSGLWSELARIIDELRPRYAIMENVAALLSGGGGRWFGRVLGDLAEIGYDAEWHCIPASAVGAPHQRDRVWIISYPQHSNANRTGLHRKEMHQQGNDESRNKQVNEFRQVGEVLAHPNSQRLEGGPQSGDAERVGTRFQQFLERRINGDRTAWAVEPQLGRVADGIPNRSHRLKGLGNAVVPQIPELIGRAILDAEIKEAQAKEVQSLSG